MRSRYTAFTEGRLDYIQKTMRGPALLNFHKKSAAKQAPRWLGLTVVAAYLDSKNPDIGYVEFIGQYKQFNQASTLHELSEFQRIEGSWYYINGQFLTDPAIPEIK